MTYLLKNIRLIGRLFFATATIASGLQQLIRGDFVRLVPKLPAWVPSQSLWVGVSGVGLIIVGLAIAAERHRRLAALALSALFAVVFLLYLPGVIANPGAGFMWTNPCKTLALLGSAILLAVGPVDNGRPGFFPSGRGETWAMPLCSGLMGVFLVVCGVQHFVYADFVAQMVPAWIPGQRVWAAFTGLALIAGGVGINLRPTSRLAAVLSGLMIFLWMVLLHIPRAFAHWPDPGETSGIFEALALSGTALMLVPVRKTMARSAGWPATG